MKKEGRALLASSSHPWSQRSILPTRKDVAKSRWVALSGPHPKALQHPGCSLGVVWGARLHWEEQGRRRGAPGGALTAYLRGCTGMSRTGTRSTPGTHCPPQRLHGDEQDGDSEHPGDSMPTPGVARGREGRRLGAPGIARTHCSPQGLHKQDGDSG